MKALDKEQKEPLPVSQASRDREGRDEVDPEIACGLGAFRPECLQGCLRMGTFVGVYSVSGLMTSVLSMYIVSQITTIEKHFGFSSAQSGLLLSCNDIGFLLTTIFASYAARKVHIPRVLWVSTVFYGIGGLVCSTAYFVSKDVFEQKVDKIIHANESLSDFNKTSTFDAIPKFKAAPLCTGVQNASTCGENSEEFEIGLPNRYSQIAMGLLAFGMILQGIGKSPRYPFIATYVDDNGKKKNTAMYMGIIAGVGIFGPAIAFSVGGVFSKIYVTLEDVSISPRHPSWIGAWWLGFVIFGIISILTSFPLVCFPRRMKPERVYETRHDTCCKYVTGFLRAILRLFRNRVYVLMLANQCIALFSVGGMVAFSAKYLETQFFTPTWKANILLGAVSVVSASLGTVIGGLIVTKRRLTPIGCLKFLIGLCFINVLFIALGYVMGCGNANIVGFTPGSSLPDQGCVSDCHCDPAQYFPACGSDGRNYFSPCSAGCKSAGGLNFTDCACAGNNVSMVPGLCETDCKMLIPFLVISVLGNLVGTMSMMPGFIVTIRSVSEEDKSMAVGLGALLSSLLGWFLGPVVFGRFIDTTCMIWNTSCNSRGACALYDNDNLRVTKTSLELIPRILSNLLYILVFIVARKKTDWSIHDPVKKGDNHDVVVNVKSENGVKKALL